MDGWGSNSSKFKKKHADFCLLNPLLYFARFSPFSFCPVTSSNEQQQQKAVKSKKE